MPSKPPPSAIITRTLRDCITKLLDSADPSELTLRRVRKDAEQALGLEPEWFKHAVKSGWKDSSRVFVTEEVARQEELRSRREKIEEEQPQEDDDEQEERELELEPIKQVVKPAPPDDHKSESDKSELRDDSPPPRKKKRTKEPVAVDESSSDMSDVADEVPKRKSAQKAASRPKSKPERSDDSSELSDVIDEAPKRRSAKKTNSKSKSKADKSKASNSATAELSEDDAEIKRLQGWLIKCGIRKLWHRELEPYSTPKAKIAHLKSMLQDAGMTGRYSLEKARQIKEERELKEELEAVSEGNKVWGNPKDGEEGGRRRQIPKGLQELDFLVDEESD